MSSLPFETFSRAVGYVAAATIIASYAILAACLVFGTI